MESNQKENKSEKLPSSISEFLRQSLRLIIQNRKWALLPIWILLLILALVLLVTGHSAVLPAIYILF